MKRPAKLFTVGHSTRTLEDFLDLLRSCKVEQLVDVRSIPRSKHNPQFNSQTLRKFLRNRRINYSHIKKLGGLRHTRIDSVNTAWRNRSFRGFADYMQTELFLSGLERLLKTARRKTTAIMCAEAVPWRCHRSLIADALIARGVDVYDIYSRSNVKEHMLNKMAKINGSCITYPLVRNV